MNNIKKNGDEHSAICPFCEQIRTFTLVKRDIPLSSTGEIIPNILVGVCDYCGHIISIPQQSTASIKKWKDSK